MQKLRIAQIAGLAERVPPRRYGGTERVIYALTEELARRGHNVTLFASGDSQTSGKLVAIFPKSLREARWENVYGPNILSLLNIGYAYQKQKDFDIIHDHNSYLSLPTANIATTPVVMTLHGTLGVNEKRIFENLRNPYLVTISKAQSELAPDLNYIGNVYNGLDMKNYSFSNLDDGYLLLVGRISREKGVHLAIEVAQYLDLPLIIAAKLNNISDAPHDVQYFHEYVEPKLSSQIRWIGEVNDAQRNNLMSHARCLLHPVTWREPFGLTLIEAMACGCPVVAFNKGSIPEIVSNGQTGFIVEDIDGMIRAVADINGINRAACREYALKQFTVEKMTDGYEAIYQRVIQKQKRSILKNYPLVI